MSRERGATLELVNVSDSMIVTTTVDLQVARLLLKPSAAHAGTWRRGYFTWAWSFGFSKFISRPFNREIRCPSVSICLAIQHSARPSC